MIMARSLPRCVDGSKEIGLVAINSFASLNFHVNSSYASLAPVLKNFDKFSSHSLLNPLRSSF